MMRNAPLATLDDAATETLSGSPRAIGDIPVMRLTVLMILITAPLCAIVVRLSRLQGGLTDQYAAAWETTTVSEESIPCRDGRILSVDGQVLAHDRIRYDVLVHFRWLQDPPDERWLSRRALSGLNRRDRRRRTEVEAAEQAVLEQQRKMWESLATALDVPQSDLSRARSDIQRRVARILESVTERRNDRIARSLPDPPWDELLNAADENPFTITWWQRLQSAVVKEVTTTPSRLRLDPVIVQEELDHHVVAVDVGLDAITTIETAPSLFPGVLVRKTRERVYPQLGTAGHVIGVRTERRPGEEIPAAADTGSQSVSLADAPGRIGRSGIERSLDSQLRGRRGARRIVRDRAGEIISQTVIRKPVPGDDVVLTIDLSLQRIAERLLDESVAPRPEPAGDGAAARKLAGPRGGCFVMLDVRTGDVVAAAAAPRHDLQLLTRPDPERWRAALADPRRPFFPRVTQMAVPPGSVFKILTAVALLESGHDVADEPFFCQGYLDHPHRNRCYIYRHYGIGHGDVSLSDAICQSCNVYFFNAARTLGPAVITDWAARFGLGVATGAEVPGERTGHLPRANRDGRIVGENWYPGSTLQFAIGQATLTVTPLQVARMVAAIANGGYLVTPRFVSGSGSDPSSLPSSESGREIHLVGYESGLSPPQAERISGLSSETLVQVREAMTRVVQTRKGTGRRAAVDGVSIAGKTGTAEVGGGKPDHAWFVGFVPAESPRYAFAIVLEHGGSGGRAAAPIAKQFIEAMADAGLLQRTKQTASGAD